MLAADLAAITPTPHLITPTNFRCYDKSYRYSVTKDLESESVQLRFLPENLLKARTLVDTIVQDDQCLTVMTTLCTELDEVAAQVGESQNPPSHCGHEGFR